jgi:hypothetical protein
MSALSNWIFNFQENMNSYGTAGLILVLIGVVIAILWVLLPFAVFGIKDMARTLIEEQRTTNKLLERIATQGNKQP